MPDNTKIHNPSGKKRIVVTKMLPGEKWLDTLIKAGYRVEVSSTTEGIISKAGLLELIGDDCTGVMGQLTETWDAELFEALKKAGGKIYCNYAVGYDNVDVEAATEHGIAIGNTPGVLTETTAEMAVALTMASARRIVEADSYTREGKFDGWLPGLFLGELLHGKTVGIVGAGRIGSSYAMMMVQGFRMNLIYHSRSEKTELEKRVEGYNSYLKEQNLKPVEQKKAESLEELLQNSDVVSLHVPLSNETHHLIGAAELNIMKENAILINTSRGPVIHEAELIRHCRENKNFRAGLDVFEHEPEVPDEMKNLPNITMAPHIGSATNWTREGMALLAALNIKGVTEGFPLWNREDMKPFIGENPPEEIPSVVNPGMLK
ncbi:MAG: NAD(P)-dependent oxidoreductase [Balneolaceae bacterium]